MRPLDQRRPRQRHRRDEVLPQRRPELARPLHRPPVQLGVPGELGARRGGSRGPEGLELAGRGAARWRHPQRCVGVAAGRVAHGHASHSCGARSVPCTGRLTPRRGGAPRRSRRDRLDDLGVQERSGTSSAWCRNRPRMTVCTVRKREHLERVLRALQLRVHDRQREPRSRSTKLRALATARRGRRGSRTWAASGWMQSSSDTRTSARGPRRGRPHDDTGERSVKVSRNDSP